MHTRHIRLMPMHLHDSKTIHNQGIARLDGFPDFQFLFTLSGKGIVNCVSGEQLHVDPGDLLFIPPDMGHSYYQLGDEKWMIKYITFNGMSIVEGLPYDIGLPARITVLKKDEMGEAAHEELLKLFNFATDEYFERSYPDDLILHTVLYRVLYLLYSVLNKSNSENNRTELSAIPEVLNYISENLCSELSIKKIASDTGIKISSLYDAFSKEFNMTPWEYITTERLKMAQELLSSPQKMSVHEVALAVGMTSKAHLSRCFKQHYGITPGKYRATNISSCGIKKRLTAAQLPVYLTSAQEAVIKSEEVWESVRKGNTWQLMLCLDGAGVLTDRNDDSHFIRPGYICLLTPESKCRYAPAGDIGGPWRVLKIQFSGAYAKELINILRMSSVSVIPSGFTLSIEHRFSPAIEYSFINNFDRLCSYSYKQDDVSALYSSVILHELLTYISIAADAVNDATGDERKLIPVIDIINMYYNQKLSVEDLAEAIGVNTQTLIRLFKNVYNTTPGEYIISLRIVRAKQQLLRHPGKYVSEIAERTGFSRSSHFIDTFKKHEGMTPDEYRSLYV